MRFFLLCLICFLTGGLFAQQLPFQGKLLENGQPVTGQRTFVFTINSSGVNWTETHTNVPVTNGLYALILGANNPLPNSLFSLQTSLPLQIQVNGQSVGSVNLYAPIERDPSVPAGLKDGVSWEEVSGKPVLDESTTNEIQTLSVSGNNLSISGGNTIQLPNVATNPETLNVGVLDTVTATAVEQLTFDGTSTRNFIWQSFTMLQTAKIKAIELNFANGTNVDIRCRLYNGTGINTQSFWSQDFPAVNYGSTIELQSFPAADFLDATLNAGATYTFYVAGIGDDLFFRTNSGNPYAFGETNINSTTDAVFKIIIETVEGQLMEVTPEQTVINTPLVVNDRVEDKTGFITPVGAVIPYAGSSPPKGWLLCDGSPVSRELYGDLFMAIGTNWGQGDGSSTFNIPDLRGQFLRGVDNGAGKDPEAASRGHYNNGNSGDNVGSFQGDVFKGHRHPSIEYTDSRFANNGSAIGDPVSGVALSATTATSNMHLTGQTGGSETRPINAYVNYIIKY